MLQPGKSGAAVAQGQRGSAKTGPARLSVLLCRVEDMPKLSLLLGGDLRSFGLKPFGVDVPRYMAQDKEAYDRLRSSGAWPQTFHRKPPRDTLTDADLPNVALHMRRAIAEAEEARRRGDAPVGAVIVDSATGAVVGSAGAHDSTHPLRHASMCVIENVAARQRREKCKVAETKSGSVGASTQSISRGRGAAAPSHGQYLCTGFDVYTTREPCVMCAMALLHSRVRRVIYGRKNEACGGLGSRFRVHEIAQLNHHFQVYRLTGGDVFEECAALYAGDTCR